MEGGESFNGRKKNFEGKLNTKGCCFLCLTVIELKTEVEDVDGDNDDVGTAGEAASKEHSSVSLRILNRYLNINLKQLLPKSSSSDSTKESSSSSSLKQTEDPKVDLCKACGRILGKFSKLFLSWEKIQLEMDYWQGKIHRQISNASKIPELVQNYSKRMTSDPETLNQLVFVDNLRKEISKMSFTKSKIGSEANVKLQRLNKSQMPPAKIPDIEEPQIDHALKADLHEGYVKEDFFEQTPPSSPPPYSPPVASSSSLSKIRSSLISKDERKKICRDTLQQRLSAFKAKQNDPSYKFACPMCGKKFTSRSNMLQHNQIVHLKKKTQACDLCPKTFFNSSNLRDHKNATHLGITFKCGVCSKEFKYRTAHNQHERKCGN